MTEGTVTISTDLYDNFRTQERIIAKNAAFYKVLGYDRYFRISEVPVDEIVNILEDEIKTLRDKNNRLLERLEIINKEKPKLPWYQRLFE